MPIFAGFKSHERLKVLEKCEVVDVSFGGYVFREGEAADAIYWLLEGQVKILKRKQYKVIEIRTLEKDRMFGLYCLKHGNTVRELSTKVSQNGTQVLIIYREQLEQMCLEKGTTMDKLLENIKSELHYPVKARSVPRKVELNREELRKREKTLCKRIKGFETEHNLKNSYINDLLQTKTLLFKVRDLNETSKRESRAGGVKKYVFDLSSEEKSRRFGDRGRYT